MKTVTRWVVLRTTIKSSDGWEAMIFRNEHSASQEVYRWEGEDHETVGPVMVVIQIPEEKEKSRG